MIRRLTISASIALVCLVFTPSAPAQPDRGYQIATTHQIHIGASEIQVDFATGDIDLPIDTVLAHVQSAASAVTSYFGRFPVQRARILIIPVPGKGGGILQGTTWGDMSGFQAFTRIRIGQHSTTADLADDWTTTHEMVHYAFPSMPEDQHWMEEGLATYIEPIARVETGELTTKKIWTDMVRDMHKGEPAANDQGLDHTHTWGRTYWRGLFCLVADVEIRRETKNRKGLRDALRAIVANGGTIDHDWGLPQALEIGDRATGTHVLTEMYAKWKDTPTPVDLDKLWSDLGIHSTANGIEFAADAPLSKVREAIATDPPHHPKPL